MYLGQVRLTKKTLFKDFNSGESKLNERILFCLNCIKDMSAWGDSEYRAILVDMVNMQAYNKFTRFEE